jgi:hypothetical protein
MNQNKVVVRYLDGRILKGSTSDFMPNKDSFHLTPDYSKLGEQIHAVNINECKALFFVKDFMGKPDYQDKKEFHTDKTAGGRKIKVVFKDKEILVGTTQGYQPGRPGFFLFPADSESNIERCFVVSAATQEISFI